MRHAKHVKNREWIKSTGLKTATLDDEPEPLPHAQLFWRAFTALSDRRTYDQGAPQPLQLTEILAYLKMNGLDDDREIVTDTLHYVVALDRHYIEHARKVADMAHRRAEMRRRGGHKK